MLNISLARLNIGLSYGPRGKSKKLKNKLLSTAHTEKTNSIYLNILSLYMYIYIYISFIVLVIFFLPSRANVGNDASKQDGHLK